MKTWYVGVKASACRYATSEVDPSDRWSRESSETDWTVNGIEVSDEEGYGLLPIDTESGKPVYVVYAIWSTGDSFGHDAKANLETFGVYATREEALAESKRLHSAPSGVPWNGYFESLDEIAIVSGIV